jgi:hypothetical protein
MSHLLPADSSRKLPGFSIAVAVLLIQSLFFESGCARQAVVTHGKTGATPERIAAPPPPIGPGRPDRDRPVNLEPEPAAASGSTQAPLTTTNVSLTQGDPFLLSEAETAIAIDPNNPLRILAASIGSPNAGPSVNQYYASLDGGQTWTQGGVAGQLNFQSSGDPSVAFCGDGTAYYASLILKNNLSSYRSGIIVDSSTDGGVTWPDENRSLVIDRTTASFFDITDKSWITCDTTNSAFAGRIYLEYGEPQSTTRVIKVKRSIDHGATWSAPVVVSDAYGNIGAVAIGPGGELYVSWAGDSGSQTSGPILFDKSTNGGVSFGTDITAVPAMIYIANDPLFRRSSIHSMAVDRSNGPYRGNIYIAFSDLRNGDPDILLVRSTNGGTTWSAPIRVNDDPAGSGADQWAQGLAVDPLGRVIVTFSDRRRYVGTERYEVWGAISRDGGQTFDSNFLIGDTPSDVTSNTFLGDYDGVAATATRLYATWADQRPGLATPADVYTDAFPNTFAYDEVKGVVWTSASQMSFQTQDARFGLNLDYDVVGGLLSELRADRVFNREACIAPAWPAPPLVDGRIPPVADGYYYLVRAHGPGGVGSYGDASPERPNLRDPLDETLIACP